VWNVSAREDEERFARFRLVEWWDQARLAEARLVVVGAGALGNELIKNFALLGVGQLVVVDLDRIEVSNLSRAVLFRPRDTAEAKALVAARAARDIYPGLEAVALQEDVVHGVGLGLFRWADVVLGALDNREARLAVNRACYRVGRPFVDGGIDVLSGVARVFLPPDGPCFECTMGEADWKALEQRRSCSLLNRELVELGHVPTSPTTASIIAGIQSQEVLKLLHGQPTLAGSAFVFEGRGHSSYLTTYTRSDVCMSHEPLERVETRNARAATTTGAEALGWAREALGPRATVEFVRELLLGFECPGCGAVERSPRPLASASERDAVCSCGARRAPQLFHGLTGDEDFLDRPLAQLGVPPWDVVCARDGERLVGFELAGDSASVLGPLAERRRDRPGGLGR
jgi:molybdopterin/thiamine biosynthesis adenylyltransferase